MNLVVDMLMAYCYCLVMKILNAIIDDAYRSARGEPLKYFEQMDTRRVGKRVLLMVQILDVKDDTSWVETIDIKHQSMVNIDNRSYRNISFYCVCKIQHLKFHFPVEVSNNFYLLGPVLIHDGIGYLKNHTMHEDEYVYDAMESPFKTNIETAMFIDTCNA